MQLLIFQHLQFPTLAYPPITALDPYVPSPYLSCSGAANLVLDLPHRPARLSTYLTCLSSGDLLNPTGRQADKQAGKLYQKPRFLSESMCHLNILLLSGPSQPINTMSTTLHSLY